MGRPPAAREPTTASRSPTLTSATGARTTSKPRPRISAALIRVVLRVSAVSSAAPVDMNAGNGVTPRWTRRTTPPSWSTAMKAGYPRRAATRATDRFTRRIWDSDAMLGSSATTPPRCSRRTMGAGDPVPLHDATITCPAFCRSVIRATAASPRVGSGAGLRLVVAGRPFDEESFAPSEDPREQALSATTSSAASAREFSTGPTASDQSLSASSPRRPHRCVPPRGPYDEHHLVRLEGVIGQHPHLDVPRFDPSRRARGGRRHAPRPAPPTRSCTHPASRAPIGQRRARPRRTSVRRPG